jgi:flagellar biosynthesis protein
MSSDDLPEKKVAVALQYENEGAPVVTAKGTGSVAEQIERLAKEAGVPIEQNPMMAEALSQIEIDQEIPVELYQAVAVLIGFIMRTGRAQNPETE